jgi:hypothetical protein
MAWTTIPGRIFYPHLYGTGAPGFNWATFQTHLLDGIDDRVAFVFTVPIDGSIEGLVFVTGSVTTSQSIDIRLETVGTDGNPTGTLVAAGAIGTLATVPSYSQLLVSLGTPYTAAAGDILALVIRFTSTAGNLQICCEHLSTNVLTAEWPYIASVTTSAYVKYNRVCNFGVKIDGGYPFTGALPAKTVTHTEYIGITIGPEVGARFKLAVGMKVCGLWGRFQRYANDAFGATMRLRDAANTVLASRAFNETANVGGRGIQMFFFDEIELTADSVYRVTVQEDSTGGEWGVYVDTATVQSNSYLDAWPGGKEYYLTQHYGDLVWTDNTLARPVAMGIIVSALQSGGGGGLLVHPGMTGGMGA